MELTPEVQPLPKWHRRFMFLFLIVLFVTVLPFLFLYATGYRFNFGEDYSFVRTGGIYVAAERTGAEIYIDNELVRETRTFRKAFYAQGLEPGTHRLHVQKPGHHTWVKELPVYPHLVTEAQAFNMPLVPSVRIISPWKDATGTTLLTASSTLLASTTNPTLVTTRIATSSRIIDTEYASLLQLFGTTTEATSSDTLEQRAIRQVNQLFSATTSTSSTASTTVPLATTTKQFNNVKLFEQGDDVYAMWTGPRQDMPYYYCAEDFELLGTTSPLTIDTSRQLELEATVIESEEDLIVGPVQSVTDDAICEPAIRLDRKWETIRSFDFFPGSTDLVVLALESGVYVVEVDDRGWQNVQPIAEGEGLDIRVQNGTIYIFDGTLMYQIVFKN